MAPLRTYFIASVFGLAAFGKASPLVLIVKVPPDAVGKLKPIDGDPHDNLVQFTAQEFDDDARVKPIAWGLTDPYFRSAVDSGTLKVNPKGALLADALGAGTKLKVDYVMTVCVWRQGSSMLATTTLYKKGKALWRDPPEDDPAYKTALKNQQEAEREAKKHHQKLPETQIFNARQVMISNSGDDDDNSLRSLAHTWVLDLADGPFKSMVSTAKPAPPKVDVGQSPPQVVVPPATKVDNKDLLANAMKLLADHHSSQAIDMLRDAVDTAPLDMERRRALINALSQTGQPAMAAMEARRAAALLPDQVELHVLAAQDFMAAGQPDEAMTDLKEAVARDPNGPQTRQLLGEVDLYKGQLPDAITHFDFVISKNPSADVYYDRALAKSLSGDSDGATQDFDAAKKNGLDTSAASSLGRYNLIELLFEKNEEDFGPRSRSVMQRARVNPADPPVATEKDALIKKVSSEVNLLGLILVPDAHKHSCDRRLLALKLLLQCYSDLDEYIKAPSDDTMGDATITLGEGLKNLDQVKGAFQVESQKG